MTELEELRERKRQLEQALEETNSETLEISFKVSDASKEARACRANVALDGSATNKKKATQAAKHLDEISRREAELFETRQALEAELDEVNDKVRIATAADLKEKRKRVLSVVEQELRSLDDGLHELYAKRMVLLAMSIGFHASGLDPHPNATKIISKKKLSLLYPQVEQELREKHSLQGVL